jgi:site-specific recombinase XerD
MPMVANMARREENCAQWASALAQRLGRHPRTRRRVRPPSTHLIQGDELRALRRLQRESPTSPFVFVSERGSPFTTAGLARMIERAAAGACLEIKAHPHMLRHACGYALANKGHDTRAIQGWLGHRSITSTAVYTALAPRFKDFWRD